MSMLLEATCEAGVVKVGDTTITTAEVLSEGVGASEGVLLMQGDKQFYHTSNASDLKDTLEKLADAITEIANTLTAIGAGMTGPTTAPPPTLPTSVTQILSIVTELQTLKENLK